MKDYYKLYVELSLQQCNAKDYLSKQKVKQHNAAVTKLARLEEEMKQIDCEDILLMLLRHEDARVKLNAAGLCLRWGILFDLSKDTVQAVLNNTYEDNAARLDASLVWKILVKPKMLRDDFKEFHRENDLACIYGSTSIHFHTHDFIWRKMMQKNGLISQINECVIHPKGVWFEGDKVYFSTHRKNKLHQEYSFLIYKCDLYGNNMQLVYEKNGYKKDIHSVIVKDKIFYIEYSVKSDTAKDGYVTQIDTYDLSTGTYTSAIARGEDCSLEDYYEKNESWQMVDKEQDYFEILLPGETESIIIDKDFMNATVYADSMNKYPFVPHKWGIVDGRILLVYQCWKNTNIVYEYDLENHALIYKMVGFWDDYEDNDFHFIE